MSFHLIFLKIKNNIIKVLLFLGLYFLYAILFLDTSSEVMPIGFYQSSKHLFTYIVLIASLSSGINAFSLNYNKVKNQLSFGYTRRALLMEVMSRIIVIAIFLLTILFFHNIFLVLLGQKVALFPLSHRVDILVYLFCGYLLFSAVGYSFGILGKSQFLFLGINGILLIIVLLVLLIQNLVLFSIIALCVSVILYIIGTQYFYKKNF